MKGSDKWGPGGGPRVRTELIVALLVVATLIGVYVYYLESNALTSVGGAGGARSISTTGVGCDDSSMPPSAQAAEQDASFTSISDGLCYDYMGESVLGGVTTLTFDYYNGTIAYPCGTVAVDLVGSQILARVSASGAVTSVTEENSSLNDHGPCPATPPAVEVVSVADVESTIPAVPQLNVTLRASPGASQITSLKAVLTLDGGSQQFQLVSSPSTLAAGKVASKVEIVLEGVTFNSNENYPMAISGAFADGQTFSYEAYVQVAQVP
jgi:hypothetical protein